MHDSDPFHFDKEEAMVLSERVRNVRPSGVRKIFDMARKVKDPVNLSLGEPDFDIPLPIKKEGIDWIEKGSFIYAVYLS